MLNLMCMSRKKILIDLDAHVLELDANLVRALGLADCSRWTMSRITI
jgi:hypothetical protein